MHHAARHLKSLKQLAIFIEKVKIIRRLRSGIVSILWWGGAPGALRLLHRLACIAAFTLVGVYGIERSRMPVASNTAFEIAEGMTEAAGSPAPHGFSVGRSIRSMTISGTRGNLRIG